ncbi:hypothetical protein QQP08_014683 [Theobroma cacao]|nr:hypothetical protein QQP08_014683 [Theobroma cacao]
MATAQFQISGRKPLQAKNFAATGNNNIAVVSKEGSKIKKSKPKQGQERMGVEIWVADESNKENLNQNHPHIPTYAKPTPAKKIEALDLDSSLAEELSAIRKKLERLRLDKEKTERMLKERDAVLHFQTKELEDRGQIQKQLEIEVDRLFRLKELKSYCMRISPIKSLRERQHDDKKINGGQLHSLEIKAEDSEEESVDENTLQSPTPSDSSEFHIENNDD